MISWSNFKIRAVSNFDWNQLKLKELLVISSHLQNDVTFTGSISGDVFMWKGHILSKVIERAHTGPVFAMYSSIKENKIISGGKERRQVI